MKEFVLIFRMDALPEVRFSPEEEQSRMAVWEKWMDGLIARNLLAGRGNRLNGQGRTVKSGVVTNGPFAETKEIIGGYIIIRAKDIDEAAEIVRESPPVAAGWVSAEVRSVFD